LWVAHLYTAPGGAGDKPRRYVDLFALRREG